MVHTVLNNSLKFDRRPNKRQPSLVHFFNITVYGADGEYFTCEIMASSGAEAVSEAESLAREQIVDIQYITIDCEIDY